jgi:virginiamycin B lyase
MRTRNATQVAPAALLALTLALTACAGDPLSERPAAERTPTPAATTSALDDRLEAELTIGDQPDWIVAGFGSVWVSRDEAGVIDRIDPETNEVVSSIPVAKHPCNGLVAAFGSIWVPSCEESTVSRIDPDSEEVEAEIAVPKVYQSTGLVNELAAGAGGIWMVTEGRNGVFDLLIRIDPRTERVEERIDLGHVGSGVAVSEDAVWVAAPDDDLVLNVDPRAGRVVEEISGLEAPNLLATGEGGVWVLSGVRSDRTPGDGSVTRLDPISGEPVERIQIDDQGGQAADITVGDGIVWARTQFTLLAGIDPSTNTVVDRITDQKGLGGVAPGFGSTWLSDFSYNRVWRVSAAS